MKLIIVVFLLILAGFLFMLTGRQKNRAKRRREKILRRIHQARYNLPTKDQEKEQDNV